MSEILTNEKYPEIVIDKSQNSVNKNLRVEMTVELLNDILHHTHRIGDIIGGSAGGGESGESNITSDEGKALNAKLEAITKEINTMQDKVTTVVEKINTIEENPMNNIYFEVTN